jgi:hypothetical protein
MDERMLLLNAHYDDMVNGGKLGKACLLNKSSLQLCNDPQFWIDKSVYQVQKGLNNFQNQNITYVREKYLELYTLDGGVAKGSERYIDAVTFITRAVHGNRDYLVDYAIDKKFIPWSYAIYLYFAEDEDNLAIHLMERAPKTNMLKDILMYLSMRDPDVFMKIDTYLKDNYKYYPNYNSLLRYAINHDNFKIIPLLRDISNEDINGYKLTWDTIIETTILANGNLLNAVLDEASEDETYELNLNQMAYLASEVHKESVFDDVLEYGGRNYPWDWEYLLLSAIENNDVEMLKHIISFIPKNTPIDKKLLKTKNTAVKTIIDTL